MFKHLLLPVDGTARSLGAARNGINFAKTMGARVTALYVAPGAPGFSAESAIVAAVTPGGRAFREITLKTGLKYLMPVVKYAEGLGVSCATLNVVNDKPYEAIVKIAKEKECDLIVMRPSSRAPLSRWMFESETRKVLGRSKVPLLIFN